MKDMQTVFQFEFSNWIRKKSYWVVTLLIAVVLLVVTSIPTISSLFSGGELALFFCRNAGGEAVAKA